MTSGPDKKYDLRCITFAILLALCPVAQSQVSPVPGFGNTEMPEWLTDALARESGPFEPRPFKLPVRNYTAQLPSASLAEPREVERGWYVSADIEAVIDMECWIFTSPVDMAATLGNITELNLNASANAHGEITDRATYFADAGAINGAPFMALDTLLMMDAEDQQRVSIAKVRIARVDNLHIACSHNQIGFRETFANSFATLVQSMTFDRQPHQPFYREIFRQSIDGLGLGILERSMAIDADGDLALTTRDSMIVPETSSVATATDTYNLGFFRKGYELINLRNIGSVNGSVTYNLNFQPAGENLYRVVGKNGSDDLDFAVEDDAGHLSIPERMLAIQALLNDPDRQSLTFRMWQPEAALGQLIETTIAFDGDGKDRRLATVTSGANRTQVQLDDYGSYVSTEFATGQGIFRIERVHKEGDPGELAGFR